MVVFTLQTSVLLGQKTNSNKGVEADYFSRESSSIFMRERAPLFAKFGLIQKTYTPVYFNFNKEDAVFDPIRSHSAGVGASLEFGLNNTLDFDGLWTVSTGLYWTSYSMKYSGVFPAERYGFDQDATTQGVFYSGALEGGIGINRYKEINPNLFLKMGIGANVQDIFIRNQVISGFAKVVQNGEQQITQIFQTEFDFSQPFASPSHTVNFVGNIALGKAFSKGQMLLFEFRFCNAKEIEITDKITSTLGIQGTLEVSKRFAGFDISFIYPINQRPRKQIPELF